jgi:hypothetical protein
MAATALKTNRAAAIGELYTEADLEALNAALADHGIGAERIISVLPVPAETLLSARGARLRVLYRAV